MNETAETKVCPFCAETIKAAAKKCPFCNSRLVKYAMFWQELSTAVGFLFLSGIFIFAIVEMAPESSGDGGRSFARHRGDLQVNRVSVDLVKSGTSTFEYEVSGFVTNEGEFPWRVREFELTISNAASIADARNKSPDQSFVVQPHTEHAFAFHPYTTLTNPVVSARVRVADARDGDVSDPDNY